MQTITDSEKRKYIKTDSGTCYNEGTDLEVIRILESIGRGRQTRIRIWLGDKETGKSWNEENDVCGYVGRSNGNIKIPLLIHKSTSFGGGALLTDCIVKIVDTKTKRVLWHHPKFSQSNFTVLENVTLQDGQLYGNCKNNNSSQRLADFMNGKRMSK